MSLAVLNQGIVRSKDSRLLRFTKAAVCLHTKDYDTAQKELEAILTIDPDNEAVEELFSSVTAARRLDRDVAAPAEQKPEKDK